MAGAATVGYAGTPDTQPRTCPPPRPARALPRARHGALRSFATHPGEQAGGPRAGARFFPVGFSRPPAAPPGRGSGARAPGRLPRAAAVCSPSPARAARLPPPPPSPSPATAWPLRERRRRRAAAALKLARKPPVVRPSPHPFFTRRVDPRTHSRPRMPRGAARRPRRGGGGGTGGASAADASPPAGCADRRLRGVGRPQRVCNAPGRPLHRTLHPSGRRRTLEARLNPPQGRPRPASGARPTGPPGAAAKQATRPGSRRARARSHVRAPPCHAGACGAPSAPPPARALHTCVAASSGHLCPPPHDPPPPPSRIPGSHREGRAPAAPPGDRHAACTCRPRPRRGPPPPTPELGLALAVMTALLSLVPGTGGGARVCGGGTVRGGVWGAGAGRRRPPGCPRVRRAKRAPLKKAHAARRRPAPRAIRHGVQQAHIPGAAERPRP
jgi:hypothetical protein